MAPLRKVFKHKAHLGSTTSNNIIHAHSPYGFIDFEQHHLINMLISVHKQLNSSSILGRLAYISLISLQLKYWTSDFPLSFIQNHKRLPHHNNLLESIIWSAKALPISLQFPPTLHFHINGGSHPLCNLISNFAKHNKLLRHSHIMFLDQLTSFEGTHLLPWSTIKSTFAVLAKPKPKWIKLLESVLISSTSRCLSSYLQSALRDITTYMPDPNCPDISHSIRE